MRAGIFQLIEGIISIKRPPNPLPYFAQDGAFAPAANVLFDFSGVKRDIKIQTARPITLRFNTVGSNAIALGAGTFEFNGQWADKAYVTFTFAPNTQFSILAHG